MGTQGDTLPPSPGTLGASRVVGSGLLPRTSAWCSRPPARLSPASACYLASAPRGRAGIRPRLRASVWSGCSGEGSEWWPAHAPRDLLLPPSGWWEGSRPPGSKPPGISVQLHQQWPDFFCLRTHCSHLSGRSPSKPDTLPRPGYGDLGSARCHPARQLWSWLVSGKPSRKHHQLRVRKGCGGRDSRRPASSRT